ncbi:MAG: sigma-54-dependent transcriptional regulator [Pseudomonadales bacterium]
MNHILLVEDEAVIRTALKRLLERNSYKVAEAASVSESIEKHDLNTFNLIISDLRLPGAPGTDLIQAANNTPVLIMTSYASLRSAVDSMKMGAVDYIAKPFDHDEMLQSVQRIISQSGHQLGAQLGSGGTRITGMIGQCAEMNELIQSIHKIAPTESTVLIQGETGTGKELVAKAIHAESRRADQPLISVNCAAIPETLIESELFGYEKGAFTGANTNRIGLIEAADGGTLFLDEIGELPLEAQARLLRVLQEGEIRRIGSTQSTSVNVRLVSATHRNLSALAKEGEFRQDLFYRINVLHLTLPPLRERGRDILNIAEAVIQSKCEELGHAPVSLMAEAVQAITTYDWPGNVRELENALERAIVLCEDDQIGLDLLDIDHDLVSIDQIQDDPIQPVRQGIVVAKNNDPNEDLSLEDYFQRFVLEHQDHMSETELAKKLGVSRKCLWERRQRFGIPRVKSSIPSKEAQSKLA